MISRVWASAVAAVLFVGCGPQEMVVEGPTEAMATTSSLVTGETLITFHDDWNISRSNLLVKGHTVRVSYDADRLPQCRGETNGHPAWSVTGYYQINDGPIGSFEAGGYSPSNGTAEPVFQLTDTGTLKLWFQITNIWGCSAWDSNFGNNFTFEVLPQPKLTFHKDWSETVEGVPGTDDSVTVSYSIDRLPYCRQTYNGMQTWDVLAYYRFDGGAVQYKSVTAVSGYMRYGTSIEIYIPEGAQQLEMWFKNTDRAGCVAWDSNYGQNYKFQVN